MQIEALEPRLFLSAVQSPLMQQPRLSCNDRATETGHPRRSRLQAKDSAPSPEQSDVSPNLTLEEIYFGDIHGHRISDPTAGMHVSVFIRFLGHGLPGAGSFQILRNVDSSDANILSTFLFRQYTWTSPWTNPEVVLMVGQWTVLPGHPTMTVTLNSNGQIQESDETDNASEIAVNAGDWNLPAFPNLPVLHSLPTAPSAIYLDFDGNLGKRATPAFDLDNDAKTLSAKETRAIRTIWSVVAEDFAPFNVDVTTIEPKTEMSQWLRVCIGGAWWDWYGSYVGGLGGQFGSLAPAYVFQGIDPTQMGNAVSHEVGHSLGLLHQATYSKNGVLLSEYNPGHVFWSPIMGAGGGPYCTWYNGPTPLGPDQYQDDLAVLAGVLGYRPDDYPDTMAHATVIPSGKSTVSRRGIIGKSTDTDVFSFQHSGGLITIKLLVATVANLDSVLIVRDKAGKPVATSNLRKAHDGQISRRLPRGRYYIYVKSTGAYGSVGQYTLTVITPKKPVTPQRVLGPSH
jgi:hypothetical protein